jgi:hypothetical protein
MLQIVKLFQTILALPLRSLRLYVKQLLSFAFRGHLRTSLLHEKHNGHHEWMSLQNEFRPVGTRIYPVRRARIASNQAFQTAS